MGVEGNSFDRGGSEEFTGNVPGLPGRKEGVPSLDRD